MSSHRFCAVLVAAFGLSLGIVALATGSPSAAHVAALAVLYATNVVCAFAVARSLGRSSAAWGLLSIGAPFVVPLVLGFLPATSREPMAFADVDWSRADDRHNGMIITAIMMFERPMTLEALRAVVEERLLRFARFRQCRVRRAGTYFWEEDPEFDVDRHLEVVSLPEKCDKDELQVLAGQLLSTRLDFSRPLWQLHLVERYLGGSAVIVRIHHCIADGMSLVRVLLSLTDEEPSTAASDAELEAEGAAPSEPVVAGIEPAALKDTPLWKRPKRRRGLRRVAGGTRFTAKFLYAVAHLAFIWRDSKTVFRGPMDGVKKAAWSRPIELETVKSIARKLGGKINDVALTALAGALRRYLADRGESVEGVDIRVMVPVDLRRPSAEIELGNRFGLVFLDLPVGLRDPRARMAEIVRRMGKLKSSLDYVASFVIVNVLGFLPNAAEQLVNRFFTFKATGVMTNVPGPRQTLYLADRPLSELMFWVPHAGLLTTGLSILSYAGNVYLGVVSDRRRVDDPEAIATAFEVEIARLAEFADRQSTEEPADPRVDRSPGAEARP